VPKEKNSEIQSEHQSSDFIPFACHYDAGTILTKNGELLQTIRIRSGIDSTIPKGDAGKILFTLREEVRKAIRENIKSADFSVWFHTLRTRRDISLPGQHPDILSDYIDKEWRKKNMLDRRFINEFYITIIHQGEVFSLKSFNETLLSLSFWSQKRHGNKYLEKAHARLAEVTGNIILSLKGYSARKLEAFARNGIYHSEPTEFFNKIINLSPAAVRLGEYDISQKLMENKVSFGFNAIEIKNHQTHCFAGIFSAKEYTELPPEALADIFEQPFEGIITETVDFISRDKALKDYEYQQYIMEVSKDEEFAETSGLTEITKEDSGAEAAYAEHQVTIMMMEDSLADLESEARRFSAELAMLGLVIVREDLMMEDCFWSQLPANFSFIRRRSYTPSDKLAAFASVTNIKMGARTGNHWGAAITTFLTPDNTPYFFNFHIGDNGHSLILGREERQKNHLLHFLLGESRKLSPKIFYFTKNRSAEVFLKGLDGKIYSGNGGQLNLTLKMNPLLLPDSPDNRLFLGQMLEFLLALGTSLPTSAREKLPEIVARIYSLAPAQRKLGNIVPFLEEAELQTYLENFSHWHGSGKYGYIFDNDADNITLGEITGFELGKLESEPEAYNAVMAYLLQRTKISLSGKPAFVVLDDVSWPESPIFMPNLSEWLGEMKARNCAVVFASLDASAAAAKLKPEISLKDISTLLFLSADYDEECAENCNMRFEELEAVGPLRENARNLIIKQGESSTLVKFDIADMKDIAAILSPDIKAIELMEKMVTQNGDAPEKWLPPFVKKVV